MVQLPGASLPRVGESVGPFRIERELARGGLGAVFVAVGNRGERVALKVLLEPERADGRERFRREAQVGMTLFHPGLCRVLQFGEQGGLAYLTMPLLEGALPITEFAKNLPPRARVELLLQVVDALQALHEAGALHRDLKPSNVLVTPAGEAKVVDFGLVKPLERSALTEPGQILGTPHYMSPELVRGGAADADARSDVFSLGVLLHEVLAGERPFAGESSVAVMHAILGERPADLEPQLEPDLRPLAGVVRAALAKAPEDRYPSASDLGADLRAVLSGEQPSPRARRRHGRGLLAILGVFGLLTAVGLALHLGGGGPSAGDLDARAAALEEGAARWLRQRESEVAPPDPAWLEELASLQRSHAESAARVLRAAVCVQVAHGVHALEGGRIEAAQEHLAAVSAETHPLVRVLRGARIELSGGEAAVALANLEEAEAAAVRRPDVYGWRALARIRARLPGPIPEEDAEAALRDLAAVAKARPLRPAESLAKGRALLSLGDVERAAVVLGALSALPADLRTELALAGAAMDVRHGEPARALERLSSLDGALEGALEQREAIRVGCMRRATASASLLGSGKLTAEEQASLINELRVARAVREDVPLPREVTRAIMAAAGNVGNPRFDLAAALVELTPEDIPLQRTLGLLVTYLAAEPYRPQFLVAAGRALAALPRGEQWEELAVARARGLTFDRRVDEAITEIERQLPDVEGHMARRELLWLQVMGQLQLKRYEDALATADRGLVEEPDHYPFNYCRAKALVGLGRKTEAYADALRYASSGFDQGTNLQHKALAWAWDLRAQGKLTALRPAFESFLRANTLHPGWFVRAAVVQLVAGDVLAARASLVQAARGFAEGSGNAPPRFAEPSRALSARVGEDAGVLADLEALTAELDVLRGDEQVP